MTEQFDKIIKAERKIKEEIAKANLQKEELLASALDEGTIEANKINEETDTKIKEKLAEKKKIKRNWRKNSKRCKRRRRKDC